MCTDQELGQFKQQRRNTEEDIRDRRSWPRRGHRPPPSNRVIPQKDGLGRQRESSYATTESGTETTELELEMVPQSRRNSIEQASQRQSYMQQAHHAVHMYSHEDNS